MIALEVILIIVFWHWVTDFVFQDEKWALGKSKHTGDLLAHTATYSFLWIIPMVYLLTVPQVLVFIAVTFIAHTITDYFTSRWVSKKFANNYYGKPIPNFGAFSSIGFGQVLHYFQLFTLYYILM